MQKATTMESAQEKVNQWHQIDLQLKQISEKMKELRAKRDLLEKDLVEAPENILKESKLKCVQVNQAESLTFKYLERSLNKIIKNKDQATQIYEFLKRNREYKSYYEIRKMS